MSETLMSSNGRHMNEIGLSNYDKKVNKFVITEKYDKFFSYYIVSLVIQNKNLNLS